MGEDLKLQKLFKNISVMSPNVMNGPQGVIG